MSEEFAAARSLETMLPPGTEAAQFVDSPPLYYATIRITPEVAMRWLEHNAKNRGITEPRVAQYARVMSEGLWALNGETVIFDWHGDLKQGQHRLNACVRAATPITSSVVLGVDPAVMRTIDLGIPRSSAAILAMEDIPNSTYVAPMAALVDRWERDFPRNYVIQPEEQIQVLQRHPRIIEFAGYEKVAITSFPDKMYRGLAYLFSCARPDLEAEMRTKLIHGTGLTQGDPVHTLRERALRNVPVARKIPAKDWYGYIIKTWNALYQDQGLKRLLMKPKELAPPIAGLERPAKDRDA